MNAFRNFAHDRCWLKGMLSTSLCVIEISDLDVLTFTKKVGKIFHHGID